MQNKQLNTMDSFKEGFRVERDGKIITLTSEEMFDLLYLRKSLEGRQLLTDYESVAAPKEKEIIQRLKADEEICFNIADSVQWKMEQAISNVEFGELSDVEATQFDICKEYIQSMITINNHLY